MRAVYYLNQFFGQIGGEEAADHPTEIQRGAVGAAGAFQKRFSEEELEVAFTIICGDNYFAEHTEEVLEEVRQFLEKEKPDLLIAGPAFNAGRYGMACGNMLKLAQQHLGIPAVSAMYEENPGMEMFRLYGYIFPSGPNARDMRKTMKKIGDFVEKLVKDCEIGSPKEEGYFPRGIRKMVWKEKSGAVRAVDMMLKKVRKEPFETELPMPKFDRIVPSPAIRNLSKARIAVMTSGGIVRKEIRIIWKRWRVRSTELIHWRNMGTPGHCRLTWLMEDLIPLLQWKMGIVFFRLMFWKILRKMEL